MLGNTCVISLAFPSMPLRKMEKKQIWTIHYEPDVHFCNQIDLLNTTTVQLETYSQIYNSYTAGEESFFLLAKHKRWQTFKLAKFWKLSFDIAHNGSLDMNLLNIILIIRVAISLNKFLYTQNCVKRMVLLNVDIFLHEEFLNQMSQL